MIRLSLVVVFIVSCVVQSIYSLPPSTAAMYQPANRNVNWNGHNQANQWQWNPNPFDVEVVRSQFVPTLGRRIAKRNAAATTTTTAAVPLSAEAENIIKASEGLNTSDVGVMVEFIEKQKVNQCLARIICELSNNGRAHGDSGAKLAKQMLEKFRSTKHEKAKFYLDAMQAGAKAKAISACGKSYTCTSPPLEVIEVANKILHI
ncbi:hypothetical protein GZH46_02721 [Fragariocoptes setiger]|uniref:Uncharacterized protein n=1 Tax=Fragariocoptes setiger TaxID=1670756 RepID=A0ABQ7S5V7_9ACAR|nr:hypothetical protein GZH46_02721 [Fragariocoptes setiger]